MDGVSYPWWDPEFWGPIGLGCDHCDAEPKIARFSWGSLGFMCVNRWFPGRSDDWLTYWLYRQRIEYLRLHKSVEPQGHQLAFKMKVAA